MTDLQFSDCRKLVLAVIDRAAMDAKSDQPHLADPARVWLRDAAPDLLDLCDLAMPEPID